MTPQYVKQTPEEIKEARRVRLANMAEVAEGRREQEAGKYNHDMPDQALTCTCSTEAANSTASAMETQAGL